MIIKKYWLFQTLIIAQYKSIHERKNLTMSWKIPMNTLFVFSSLLSPRNFFFSNKSLVFLNYALRIYFEICAFSRWLQTSIKCWNRLTCTYIVLIVVHHKNTCLLYSLCNSCTLKYRLRCMHYICTNNYLIGYIFWYFSNRFSINVSSISHTVSIHFIINHAHV